MSTENPLIVRVVTSADWYDAYTLVWQTACAVEAARQGIAFDPVNWEKWTSKNPVRDRTAWARVRLACLLYADDAAKAGDAELAGAWSLLGADPRGPQWRSLAGGRTYVPALRELGRVIVTDPALLDDEKFCEAVEGWRFLEVAGSAGDDDLIEAAQKYGSMGRIDRSAILGWAQMWSEVQL